MTIGQLSSSSGLAPSAIRYYERLGLLARPRRQSSRRVYSPEALDHLSVIRLARSCGFRLDEIAQLLGAARSGPPSPAWKTFAASKRREIEQTLTQLRAMRRLLDRVESCRCQSILECGKLARRRRL
jgi:DNA-binding transcriptional MerR regulator